MILVSLGSAQGDYPDRSTVAARTAQSSGKVLGYSAASGADLLGRLSDSVSEQQPRQRPPEPLMPCVMESHRLGGVTMVATGSRLSCFSPVAGRGHYVVGLRNRTDCSPVADTFRRRHETDVQRQPVNQ